MKPETKLARAFINLASEDHRIDNLAAEILAIVTQARVRTLEQFAPLVSAAYAANGWNSRPGRPVSAGKGEVPATVRTYVTTVRRALRAGIRVAGMKTFTQLRTALAKRSARAAGHRSATRLLPKALRPHFVGVNLSASNDMNGALMHDLGAVFSHLPGEQRELFERQLTRLLHRYLPLAEGLKAPPAALPAPKAEPLRKAA